MQGFDRFIMLIKKSDTNKIDRSTYFKNPVLFKNNNEIKFSNVKSCSHNYLDVTHNSRRLELSLCLQSVKNYIYSCVYCFCLHNIETLRDPINYALTYEFLGLKSNCCVK